MKETKEIDVFLSSSCSSRPSWFRSGVSGERDAGRGGKCARQTQSGPGGQAGARVAGRPPGHNGAKQSQFPPEQKEEQRLGGKGVMVHRTCNRLRQNKANLPQRPPRGAGRGSHQPSRRCGVLRQTNPICRAYRAKQSQSRPLRLWRAPLFQYSIIPTFQCDAYCAKQTQFGPGGQEGAKVGGRARGGTMAPNKANFRRTCGRGKWLAGKELW